MPELPEVETVRRGLSAAMEGRAIERVDQCRADLRIPFPRGFRSRLAGRTVAAMTRRAKYILAHLDNRSVLLMHLGMSGRFAVTGDGKEHPAARFHRPGGPHEHVVFHMAGGIRVGYTDPRRFGLMDLVATDGLPAHPLLASLGPEPLGAELTPEYLHGRLSGRRTTIKTALLDQRVVAGLGNIYVCEALHRARIAPGREAAALARGGLPGAPLVRLVEEIKATLREAIEAGGSSLRDHAAADGTLGYFQHSFAVYDREGVACPRPDCGGRIRRAVQSGRSTFWCARCQR